MQTNYAQTHRAKESHLIKVSSAPYLHKNNGNSIVQHALAKDKGIEVDVNIEVIEDGEDGNGVGGRDEGTKVEVVDEGDVL